MERLLYTRVNHILHIQPFGSVKRSQENITNKVTEEAQGGIKTVGLLT